MAEDPQDILVELQREDDSLFEPHSTLPGVQKKSWTRDDVHIALAAAGTAPIIGNIADAVDTAMYLWEGEYGAATISAATMVPVIGQIISGKKVLNAAKESGEKIITLYRGVPEWTRGQMVQSGKYVGGGQYAGKHVSARHSVKTAERGIDSEDFVKSLWVAEDMDVAKAYMLGKNQTKGKLLKFEVPESYFNKHFVQTGLTKGKKVGLFPDGLPKGFITKVHKHGEFQFGGPKTAKELWQMYKQGKIEMPTRDK